MITENYFVQVPIRYHWYRGVPVPTTEVISLSETKLTGRYKIDSNSSLWIEITYDVYVDKPKKFWFFFTSYERVKEQITRFVHENKFTWETIIDCERKQKQI